MLKKYSSILCIILNLVVLLSCTSITKYKSPKVLYQEHRNRKNELELRISSYLLPGTTIYAELEEQGATSKLYVNRVSFFSNWENGWTEAVYEASGTLALRDTGAATKTISVVEEIELWNIISGAIRYNTRYYRGDYGLSKAKARIARIRGLTQFTQGLASTPAVLDASKKLRRKLHREIGPVLFPENYARQYLQRKQLNEAYLELDRPKFSAKKEGIRWNEEYTAGLFPEEYWELRNTGNFLRDYREAPDIFISFYNWDFFTSQLESTNSLELQGKR